MTLLYPWQEVREDRPEAHRVDREPSTRQIEEDDLEEIAGAVRSDCQDLERVAVGVEVSPDDRVLDGMAQIVRLHAVLEA